MDKLNTAPPAIVTERPHNIIPVIVAGVIFLLVGLLAGFYLARGASKCIGQNVVQPIIPTSTPFPVLSPSVQNWTFQLINKVNWSSEWKSFKLNFPSDWRFNIKKSSAGGQESWDAELVKGTYKLRIMQGAGDAGSCNYPTGPTTIGMAADYTEYIEVNKSEGLIWRLSKSKNIDKNFPAYYVCEKKSNEPRNQSPYTGNTIIGYVSFFDSSNKYDNSILIEVEDILKKLEIMD